MLQPYLFPLAGLRAHGPLGVGPLFPGMNPQVPASFRISGITKDETGAAAGGFTVYLFNMQTGSPVLADTTISDGSGNYSFSVGGGMPYWIVDYKAGAPDKAGATKNNLAGV